MNTVTVTDLFIYPVKSLRGVAVSEVVATPLGLAGDREWMIVNQANRFVTQRQLPQLAIISAQLENGQLHLTNARGETITVDQPEANPENVQVWKDTCLARPATSDVNEWLSTAAGGDQPLKLVQFAREQPRAQKPERFGDATTHFADAAPYLIASRESLNALNASLAAKDEVPVTINHFRPNIVISGLAAFEEHQAQHLKNSTLSFQLVDHCQRCIVVTIDPQTGQRHARNEPFTTLAGLNGMPENPKAPAFGVNATLVSDSEQRICVGDILQSY